MADSMYIVRLVQNGPTYEEVPISFEEIEAVIDRHDEFRSEDGCIIEVFEKEAPGWGIDGTWQPAFEEYAGRLEFSSGVVHKDHIVWKAAQKFADELGAYIMDGDSNIYNPKTCGIWRSELDIEKKGLPTGKPPENWVSALFSK